MFVKSRRSKKVPAHLAKYTVSVQRNGIRKWGTITCRPREIERLHGLWLDRVITEIEGISSGTFFENLVHRYLETYAKAHHQPKWLREELYYFQKRFIPFFESKLIQEIRRGAVEAYVEKRLSENAAPSLIKKEMVALSAFFSWAIRLDIYPFANPCSRLNIKVRDERYVRLTPEQIGELLTKARDFDSSFCTFVWIATLTGMRLGEILGLTWRAVDLSKRRITLLQQETKTGERREVPILLLLSEYLETVRSGEGKVVQLTENKVRAMFNALVTMLSFKDTLRVKKFRIHDLRHVAGQLMRDAGMNLSDVASVLGHSNPAITAKRYAQALGVDGLEKIDRVST